LVNGAFPFYVLFLNIDPVHIDINVHPTKTEIKFDDERSIYAIVQAAVRKTLSIHNLIPSLDFDTNVNFNVPITFGLSTRNTEKNDSFKVRPVQDAWKKLYEGMDNNINAFEQQSSSQSMKIFDHADEPKTIQSKANHWNYEHINATNFQAFQIFQKYIAIHISDGLLLIDQKKAYQRILFDQFYENLNTKNGLSQQLIFPKTIHINPADFFLIEEIKTEILALGFRIEINAENNLIVQGIPVGILEEDCPLLIEGMLEQIKNESIDFTSARNERIAQAMANKTAGKYTQKKLSNEEMNALIGQLFASSNPNFSPNGEEISKLLTENYFLTLFS
jgi:DNA mismatch repair protein MutL